MPRRIRGFSFLGAWYIVLTRLLNNVAQHEKMAEIANTVIQLITGYFLQYVCWMAIFPKLGKPIISNNV